MRLKDAGLTAYNHNLDSSREFYPSIVSTRTYDDRLETVANVRAAGISVCTSLRVITIEKRTPTLSQSHTL